MQRLITFIILTCFATVTFAQNNSSIDFTIRNLGLNVEGHFDKFTIMTTFNAEKKLTALSGEITVSSIDTGIDSRDEHLLRDDYFDAKKFKTIRLKSITITAEDNERYIIKAKLSVKGKTKRISIPVTVKKEFDRYKIKSNFEINRRDFNVGGRSFVMSNTAKINVVYYQKF